MCSAFLAAPQVVSHALGDVQTRVLISELPAQHRGRRDVLGPGHTDHSLRRVGPGSWETWMNMRGARSLRTSPGSQCEEDSESVFRGRRPIGCESGGILVTVNVDEITQRV